MSVREQVETYLTVLRPQLEGKVGSWKIDTRGGAKGRFSSRVERSALALADHPDNAHAALLLEPILKDFATYYTGERPFICVQCLSEIRDNPGALTQWRESKTEDARYLADLFDEAIGYIAAEYEDRYPNEELEVHIDLRDLPVRSGREAQKKDTEWQDAVIVSQLEALEHEEGLSRTEAKQRLASESRGLYSVRRIQSAIGGVKQREAERERKRRKRVASPGTAA